MHSHLFMKANFEYEIKIHTRKVITTFPLFVVFINMVVGRTLLESLSDAVGVK